MAKRRPAPLSSNKRTAPCIPPQLQNATKVRETSNNLTPEPFRWTAEALMALQEVCVRARVFFVGWGGKYYLTQPQTQKHQNTNAQQPQPQHRQATEDFMVHLFEDCNLCAIHARRVTISCVVFFVCLFCGMVWEGRERACAGRAFGSFGNRNKTTCTIPTKQKRRGPFIPPLTKPHQKTKNNSAQGPAARAPHPRPGGRRVVVLKEGGLLIGD
jgi:histone H3/H4